MTEPGRKRKKTLGDLLYEQKHDAERVKVRDARGEGAVRSAVPEPQPQRKGGRSR